MAYTTIDDPSEYFNIVLYTGNQSTNAITNSANAGDFQPDWVWLKARNSATHHRLYDSSRGVLKGLLSSASNAEATTANSLTSFDSNGFTLGSDDNSNQTSKNFVGWQWEAGGTAPTKTYKVVVVDDSGNKYRFRNSADSATFAQSAVTLDLQEGGTYVFDWSDSSAQGHPIRFSTTSDGTHGGGSEYTTGVVKDDSAYKTTITVSASAPTLYYYCSNHSGMGGQVNTNTEHGQTNFDGANLSVVQSNTTAGLSIIKYVGNFSTLTIGHGLSQAPEALIIKNRDTGSTSWVIYHEGLDFPTKDLIYFNSNASNDHDPTFLNTAPTNSIITMGAYSFNNKSGDDHICYAFHSIKGYSNFGSYEANNSTDGRFLNLGFKPALLILKSIDQSGNWFIFDNKRDTDNPVSQILYPDSTASEGSASVLDFVSNGVKIRNSGSGGINYSGTYIYFAFAEHPFVSSKGVPVTAR
tara:strand:+ start:1911 stop:3311 length:1401 start_codon:yes stop_codon:yes gene_type:complete